MKIDIEKISPLVSLIASISSILIVFIQPIQKGGYEILAAIIIIGILIFFILYENYKLKINWRRKLGYTKIFEDINDSFSSLNTLRRNKSMTEDNISKSLNDFCTSMAEGFSKVIGSRCSVAIKQINEDIYTTDFDKIQITTIARDEKSMRKREDTTYLSPMTIAENTDFHEIALNLNKKNKSGGKQLFYICNDIIKATIKGYRNSRFGPETYMMIKNSNGYQISSKLEQIWLLPYKSTIVVAIYPLKGKRSQKFPLKGFLCVDCDKKNAFLEWDVQILQGAVDTLYDILDNKTI